MTDWLSTGCRSDHEDCGPIERRREGLPALRLRRRGAKEARLGRPRLQEDVGRGPPRSGKQKVSERYDADERGREPRETLKLLLGRLWGLPSAEGGRVLSASRQRSVRGPGGGGPVSAALAARYSRRLWM